METTKCGLVFPGGGENYFWCVVEGVNSSQVGAVRAPPIHYLASVINQPSRAPRSRGPRGPKGPLGPLGAPKGPQGTR